MNYGKQVDDSIMSELKLNSSTMGQQSSQIKDALQVVERHLVPLTYRQQKGIAFLDFLGYEDWSEKIIQYRYHQGSPRGLFEALERMKKIPDPVIGLFDSGGKK